MTKMVNFLCMIFLLFLTALIILISIINTIVYNNYHNNNINSSYLLFIQQKNINTKFVIGGYVICLC